MPKDKPVRNPSNDTIRKHAKKEFKDSVRFEPQTVVEARKDFLHAITKLSPDVLSSLAIGHGQGSQQPVVPPYLASYLLHLTATNILLLVEAEKDLP